jgi:predicted TIM-barrel fold metal-dependent hydrolase
MKNTLFSFLYIFSCYQGLSQEDVFDIHVHLWNGEQSYKTYLAQLDSTHQPVTKLGGILIASKGEPARTRQKNDELITLSRKYPKLIPICSLHPLDGDSAIQELKRIAGLGVRVIKLHPHTQNFDVKDEKVHMLCQLAGQLGMIILMDNANIKPGDSEHLFDLAVKCSGTKFIFAHMGGLNFRFWNILPLARTAKGFFMDNIYFDISATIILMADSPIEEEFIWTIKNVGIDRVLLGSDFPQIMLKQANDALERLNLTPEEKNKIRYKNAMQLLSANKNK